MLVGAEQARKVVTLVTSEAPSSLLWVETISLVGRSKQYGFFSYDLIRWFHMLDP